MRIMKFYLFFSLEIRILWYIYNEKNPKVYKRWVSYIKQQYTCFRHTFCYT